MMPGVIDGMFVFGLVMFQLATIRQLRKVWKTKETLGISLTHYKWKIIAIVSMTAGYGLSCLWGEPLYFSCVVSSVELALNFILLYYASLYRRTYTLIDGDGKSHRPVDWNDDTGEANDQDILSGA